MVYYDEHPTLVVGLICKSIFWFAEGSATGVKSWTPIPEILFEMQDLKSQLINIF